MYLTKWITAACLAAFCALGSAPAAAELGVDWERASNDHPFVLRQHVGLVEYRGKLYAGGGFRCADIPCSVKVYYGDLWESVDGIEWQLIWQPAPFPDLGDTWVPPPDVDMSQFRAPLPQFLVFDEYFYYLGTSWGGIRTRDFRNWEYVDYGGNSLITHLVEFKGVLYSPSFAEFSEDGVNFEHRLDLELEVPFVGSTTAVATEDYVYVYQQRRSTDPPQIWRSNDFENWIELNQGNVHELEVFSTDDVRLTYFAGYLWLGGRFKIFYSGSYTYDGQIWKSSDGENWELVGSLERGLAWEGGSLASFGTSLYRLPGKNYEPTYHSIGTCEEVLGGAPHAADLEGCGKINLSELLRVIQLFATQGYRCEPAEADGYAALAGTAASSAVAGSSFAVAGFPDPATLLTEGLHLSPKGEEEGATEGTAEGEGTANGASEGEGAAEGNINGEGAAEGAQEGEPCTRHSADFADPAWRITLPGLLRVVQLYNAGHYHPCPDAEPATEDGYCPGK
jgi:hypothetical protein